MQIYILLTESCNLRCRMCIRGKQIGEYLSFTKLKNSKFLRALKNHDVVITGGEPTLHPDFYQITSTMLEYAKTVTVATNGTNCKIFKKMDIDPRLHFQVSLDGDESCHDAIRGKNAYKRTMDTLQYFDKENMSYNVATVVNRNNVESIFCLAEVLIHFSVMKYWSISYEMPFGSANFDNMMVAEEWNNFVDNILKKARVRMKIKKIFPFKLYDENLERLILAYKCNGRSFNCGSGSNKLYVYPDGRVYPCTCLTDFLLGNIFTTSLDQIMHSNAIKIFHNYDLNKDVACNGCKYKMFCNGGCIGMSYHYYGRLGMGDIRCPQIRGNC